ncbi:hypothetical protein Q3G72_024903 [Acer saccharum]|nr:hypothetical protein Q3G72_024903 [Acer saccharum]
MGTVSESLYNDNVVGWSWRWRWRLRWWKKTPLILGLEPTALIDYMACVDWSLLDGIIISERGRSIDMSIEELEHILRETTNRAARLYVSNMSSIGVDVSRLRAKKGPIGQCVCLVDALPGSRTMRPCFSNVTTLQA